MTILNLNDSHFYVESKKLIYGDNRPTLIYFYMDGCSICTQMEPLLKNISNNLTTIMYGKLNLSRYNRVLQMSKQTYFPFEGVPVLIFYLDKHPIAVLKGGRTEREIATFINDMLSKANTRSTNIQQIRRQQEPSYIDTGGYNTMETAYGN